MQPSCRGSSHPQTLSTAKDPGNTWALHSVFLTSNQKSKCTSSWDDQWLTSRRAPWVSILLCSSHNWSKKVTGGPPGIRNHGCFCYFIMLQKCLNVRGASAWHLPEAYSHSRVHVMPGAFGSRLESVNIVLFFKMQNSFCRDQASRSLPDYHWPLDWQKVVGFCWQKGSTKNLPMLLSYTTRVGHSYPSPRDLWRCCIPLSQVTGILVRSYKERVVSFGTT